MKINTKKALNCVSAPPLMESALFSIHGILYYILVLAVAYLLIKFIITRIRKSVFWNINSKSAVGFILLCLVDLGSRYKLGIIGSYLGSEPNYYILYIILGALLFCYWAIFKNKFKKSIAIFVLVLSIASIAAGVVTMIAKANEKPIEPSNNSRPLLDSIPYKGCGGSSIF